MFMVIDQLWKFSEEEVSMLKKLQYELVKEFMEQIEVILRKYLSDIKKSLEDRFVIKGDGPTVALWDEVILNNIEIENAYFIRSTTNNLLDSRPFISENWHGHPDFIFYFLYF